MQWNVTAAVKNGLQGINRLNLYLRDVSGILDQETFWWFGTTTSCVMNCYKIYIY